MKEISICIQIDRNGEKFMERNSRNSQGYKLESQIREAYGRVTYSQTCHDKFINRTIALEERIKIAQIVLSAVTTSGFVVAIFSKDRTNCMPCGACRQWMSEFKKDNDLQIILESEDSKCAVFTIEELLPYGFEL